MAARRHVTATESSATARAAASIHARLRAATAPLHAGLDRRLGFLLAPGLSLARYRTLLTALHGFYAPLEPRLASAAADRPAFPVPLAARATLLERDLEALGMSASAVRALPRCSDLPALTSHAHVAGALYVVEGAALGGQVIARALSRSPAIGGIAPALRGGAMSVSGIAPALRGGAMSGTALRGAAFFSSDGAQVGARWKQVLAWLQAVDAELHAGAEMIGVACDTFAAFERWLVARGAVA